VARNEARWLLGFFNLSRLQCDSLDANEDPHTPALRPQLPLRSAFARFTVPQALRILAQTRQSDGGASGDRRPALHLCMVQTEEARTDPLAAAAFQKTYMEEERAELDAAFVHCGLFAHSSPFAASVAAAATDISTEPINDVAVTPSTTRPVCTGIDRLDANALSAVLSFLSPEDFLRALRVNCSWASLRGRVAAWPAPLQLCPCMTAKLAGVLVEELYADDAETLVRACDAYRQLIAPGPHHAHRVEAAMQCAGGGDGGGSGEVAVTDIAARTVALLGHAAAPVHFAALRLATALMQDEDDNHRRVMLNAGILPALRLLLPSQDAAALIVAEPLQDVTVVDVLPKVFLCLARLAPLGSACIEQILQCDFAELMVGSLRLRSAAIVRPAAWAVGATMRSGTVAQQRVLLLTHGALDALCDLIPRAQRDAALTCFLLDALQAAFWNATEQRQQQQQQQQLHPPAQVPLANDDADELLAALRGGMGHVFDVLWAEARAPRVRRLLVEIARDYLGLLPQAAVAMLQNIDEQEQQGQQA
jgi:hypothetical protein